jgi:hypothetical protein
MEFPNLENINFHVWATTKFNVINKYTIFFYVAALDT